MVLFIMMGSLLEEALVDSDCGEQRELARDAFCSLDTELVAERKLLRDLHHDLTGRLVLADELAGEISAVGFVFLPGRAQRERLLQRDHREGDRADETIIGRFALELRSR